MPSLPSEVKYGRVRGKIIHAVLDGPDEGHDPDSQPATGTITFQPNLTGPMTLPGEAGLLMVPDAVTVSLDSTGAFDVYLLATDFGNPTGWTYAVSFSIPGANIPTYNIAVATGSDKLITDWLPAGVSNGTLTLRGPAGVAGASPSDEALRALILAALPEDGGGDIDSPIIRVIEGGMQFGASADAADDANVGDIIVAADDFYAARVYAKPREVYEDEGEEAFRVPGAPGWFKPAILTSQERLIDPADYVDLVDLTLDERVDGSGSMLFNTDEYGDALIGALPAGLYRRIVRADGLPLEPDAAINVGVMAKRWPEDPDGGIAFDHPKLLPQLNVVALVRFSGDLSVLGQGGDSEPVFYSVPVSGPFHYPVPPTEGSTDFYTSDIRWLSLPVADYDPYSIFGGQESTPAGLVVEFVEYQLGITMSGLEPNARYQIDVGPIKSGGAPWRNYLPVAPTPLANPDGLEWLKITENGQGDVNLSPKFGRLLIEGKVPFSAEDLDEVLESRWDVEGYNYRFAPDTTAANYLALQRKGFNPDPAVAWEDVLRFTKDGDIVDPEGNSLIPTPSANNMTVCRMTQEAYDGINPRDPNTLYVIVDDGGFS